MKHWRVYVLSASLGSAIGSAMSHQWPMAAACFVYAQWQVYQVSRRVVA